VRYVGLCLIQCQSSASLCRDSTPARFHDRCPRHGQFIVQQQQ